MIALFFICTGNELVQFQPTDNFLSNIGDLTDIIDNDASKYSDIPSEPLSFPEISEQPEITIDPMSFINMNPSQVQTEEEDDTDVLDTPLVFQPTK